MAENSSIEWTNHTFNPWWGCERVSPACDDCYAAAWAHRLGMDNLWSGERREFGAEHWAQPLAWNRKAGKAGVRARVFCASMADVFDNRAPPGQRERLWRLIEATEHLDWLLLTKRIGNAIRMLPPAWLEEPRPNVWLGATLANREEMLRDAGKLKATPALIHFWSVEPMLGDLGEIPRELMPDWVICGGESGARARPMHPAWAYSLRDQCQAAGVAFFFKQWGQWKHMGYSGAEAGPDGDEGVILESDDPNWRPYMWKVGKKRAGRVLNDRTWDEFPRGSVPQDGKHG